MTFARGARNRVCERGQAVSGPVYEASVISCCLSEGTSVRPPPEPRGSLTCALSLSTTRICTLLAVAVTLLHLPLQVAPDFQPQINNLQGHVENMG